MRAAEHIQLASLRHLLYLVGYGRMVSHSQVIYHPSAQQITAEQTAALPSEQAAQFYRELKKRNVAVRVMKRRSCSYVVDPSCADLPFSWQLAPRTRMERLLGRLRRAMRIVRRLHLPQFQHAVEHDNRHGNNQKRRKYSFPPIIALAVGDIAGDD